MPSRRTANAGPDRTSTPSTGGKRRAVRADSLHTGGRKKLLPGLPSMPSLVGVAALVLAAAGATLSQQPTTVQPTVPPVPTASDVQKFANQASVLNAGSSTWSGSALDDRARAVSRDSQREALQDAAVAELQAAAESQAKERNAALAALAASAEQYADQVAARAAERAAARAAERAARLWQLPLPAGSYRLSSRFGECSYLWANCHTGLDFAASSGAQIYNVAAGVVTEVGYEGSYGNRTIVTLPDGTEMWYCHQNSFAVSVGDQVAAGELIGYVGSTGNSTGPHLHLEVHPGAGDAVDPMAAALVRGLQF